MADPTEEFEAVWAVVRRLEAHLRRLEATVSTLQQEVELLKVAGGFEPLPGVDAAPVPAAEPPDEAESAIAAGPAAGSPVYRLVFDGGSLGNPGHGYGSYHVTSPRGGTLQEQLDFAERGSNVTNNQAEYLTLIQALERLQKVLGERARSATVEIRGDSQLVVNQLNGRWKVRNPELQPLYERAKSLLAGFGRTDLRWHGRAHSVELLGH